MTPKSFSNAAAMLQRGVAGFPFLAGLLPVSAAFPPLSESLVGYKFATALITALCTLAPRALAPLKKPKLTCIATAAFCATSVVLYLLCISLYVVTITPPGHKSISVVIGAERRDNLPPEIRDLPDADFVSSRGFEDRDLEQLYTKESLVVSRAKLFVSYTASLSFFVMFLGSLVILGDQQSKPTP